MGNTNAYEVMLTEEQMDWIRPEIIRCNWIASHVDCVHKDCQGSVILRTFSKTVAKRVEEKLNLTMVR